jgi:hypothetical protein
MQLWLAEAEAGTPFLFFFEGLTLNNVSKHRKTTIIASRIFTIYKNAIETDVEVPSQLFTTQSKMLTQKVQEEFNELKQSFSSMIKVELPTSTAVQKLEEVIPDSFPLFYSYADLVQLVDASIGDSFLFSSQQESIKDEIERGLERRIANSSRYNWDEIVDSKIFELKYFLHAPEELRKMFSSNLIFTEFLFYIKGSMQSMMSENGRLSLGEYIALSRKRFSANLNEQHRLAIYKFFLEYEKRKLQNHQFDLADLMFHLLKRVQENLESIPKIGLLYIDEVQDLLPCQLLLIKNFFSVTSRVIFCGDIAQCITAGNRFKFSILSDFMYEHFPKKENAKLDFFMLKKNYRSQTNIVNLANLVTRTLKYFFPDEMDSFADEEGMDEGAMVPSYLAENSKDDLKAFLFGNETELAPEQVILVRDQSASRELRLWLEERNCSATIMTILESKGLEFDDVCLYNFFSDSAFYWRVILNADKERFEKTKLPAFDQQKHYSLCNELKELYVAVTRAKDRIVFFEETCMHREFVEYASSFIQCITTTSMRPFVVKSTEDQWNTKGKQYLNAGNYEQAVRAFSKGGDSYMEQYSLAKLREQDGISEGKSAFLESAAIFLSIGKKVDAGKCFEKAQAWKKAADIFAELGDIERQLVNLIKTNKLESVLEVIEKRSSSLDVDISKLCIDMAEKFIDVDELDRAIRCLKFVSEQTLKTFFEKIKFRDADIINRYCSLLIQKAYPDSALKIYIEKEYFRRGVATFQQHDLSQYARNLLELYIYWHFSLLHCGFIIDSESRCWMLEEAKNLGLIKLVNMLNKKQFDEENSIVKKYMTCLFFVNSTKPVGDDYCNYLKGVENLRTFTRLTKVLVTDRKRLDSEEFRLLFGMAYYSINPENKKETIVGVVGWFRQHFRESHIPESEFIRQVRVFAVGQWHNGVRQWLTNTKIFLGTLEFNYTEEGFVRYYEYFIPLEYSFDLASRIYVDVQEILTSITSDLVGLVELKEECRDLKRECNSLLKNMQQLFTSLYGAFGYRLHLNGRRVQPFYTSFEDSLMDYIQGKLNPALPEVTAQNDFFGFISQKSSLVSKSGSIVDRATLKATTLYEIQKRLSRKESLDDVNPFVWLFLFEDMIVHSVVALPMDIELPLSMYSFYSRTAVGDDFESKRSKSFFEPTREVVVTFLLWLMDYKQWIQLPHSLASVFSRRFLLAASIWVVHTTSFEVFNEAALVVAREHPHLNLFRTIKGSYINKDLLKVLAGSLGDVVVTVKKRHEIFYKGRRIEANDFGSILGPKVRTPAYKPLVKSKKIETPVDSQLHQKSEALKKVQHWLTCVKYKDRLLRWYLCSRVQSFSSVLKIHFDTGLLRKNLKARIEIPKEALKKAVVADMLNEYESLVNVGKTILEYYIKASSVQILRTRMEAYGAHLKEAMYWLNEVPQTIDSSIKWNTLRLDLQEKLSIMQKDLRLINGSANSESQPNTKGRQRANKIHKVHKKGKQGKKGNKGKKGH